MAACLLDASMAFDKCRFDLRFQKLIKKGFPASVVRTLMKSRRISKLNSNRVSLETKQTLNDRDTFHD